MNPTLFLVKGEGLARRCRLVPTAASPGHASKRGKYVNEFRQPYGASATSALHDHLMSSVGSRGSPVVFATLVTHLDHPNDVADESSVRVDNVVGPYLTPGVSSAPGELRHSQLSHSDAMLPRKRPNTLTAQEQSLGRRQVT